MDKEIIASEKARLYRCSLSEMVDEQRVIDYGAIVICRQGTATIHVDFRHWAIKEGAVISFFPNDVVELNNVSAEFEVEMLRYDPSLLREASLQIEQAVYHSMRKDRCRTDKPIVREIVNGMFNLLRIYFRQPDCSCTDQLVLCQLKAFFIGFHDYIVRNKPVYEEDTKSRRVNELFNQFMELLEIEYKQSHDVRYYAHRLCITSKYLNTIIKRVTNHTPKTIIDHYVILQLKLLLQRSDISVKQLSNEFHFSDTSFFCRYFKQHTGLTPQEFRKTSIRK